MQAKILDIGLFFPNKVYSNQDLQQDFSGLKVKELTRLTGVLSRHICESSETSVDMGVNAAKQLFAQGKIEKPSAGQNPGLTTGEE